jgi:hypothetical protein
LDALWLGVAVGVGEAEPADCRGAGEDGPGLAEVGRGLGDVVGDGEAVPLGDGDGLGLGEALGLWLWPGVGEYIPMVLLQVDDGEGVPDWLAGIPLPWATPGVGDETAGLVAPLPEPVGPFCRFPAAEVRTCGRVVTAHAVPVATKSAVASTAAGRSQPSRPGWSAPARKASAIHREAAAGQARGRCQCGRTRLTRRTAAARP